MMLKNITDYLAVTVNKYGNKTAYTDEHTEITFQELDTAAQKIASGIMQHAAIGTPVLVYMDKCAACIEAFLGIAYTGAFYVPIDIHMPYERVKLIIKTLSARIMITRKADGIPDNIKNACRIIYIEDLIESSMPADKAAIQKRQRKAIDTDPAYAIFTSGSTGIPKGVLVSHRSVINFTEWWCETFEFSEQEVFANQTPFYFDASVKDIYATLRCGATMHIVPKKLFSLPKKLIQYLNEKKVTCIDWVPSVLCMIANYGTLNKIKPEYLKKVIFLGEVMPAKQFNMWRRALPDVSYANLYGPTEATGDCTYYKIEREFEDDEPIPIGFACENTEVMLLDGDTRITGQNQLGEICVRGCSLAHGYYRDAAKTDEVFCPNPLQKNYAEKIYRTGDFGRYNEYGELVFYSRRDAQIKHMGHRIELGEIETAAGSMEGIHRICCLYEHQSQRIAAVYEGTAERGELAGFLKKKLPGYMMPNVYYKIDKMPCNLNGKIDRVLLKQKYVKE